MSTTQESAAKHATSRALVIQIVRKFPGATRKLIERQSLLADKTVARHVGLLVGEGVLIEAQPGGRGYPMLYTVATQSSASVAA